MNRGQQRAQWRARHYRRNLGVVQQRRAPAGIAHSAQIQLRINELNLNGFPQASLGRIASAFEQQLTAMLQAGSVPAAWRTEARIDQVRTITVRPRSFSDPGNLGEQLARAILQMQAGTHRLEIMS